jgi:hypothetical protein
VEGTRGGGEVRGIVALVGTERRPVAARHAERSRALGSTVAVGSMESAISPLWFSMSRWPMAELRLLAPDRSGGELMTVRVGSCCQVEPRFLAALRQ